MFKSDDVERLVKEDQVRAKPCIMCHTLTHNRAAFFPKNSERYGAPAKKQRVIVYALCDKCDDEKNLDEIEDAILRLIKAKTN